MSARVCCGFVCAILVLLVLLGWAVHARAETQQQCWARIGAGPGHRTFFDASKSADLVDGTIGKNCCGEGDAVRVRIVGSAPGGQLAAEVIDPMCHPTAKAGEIATVPAGRIARQPHAPSSLGAILFWSTHPDPRRRYAYCLMPEGDG